MRQRGAEYTHVSWRAAPLVAAVVLISRNAVAQGRFDVLGDPGSSHDVFTLSVFVALPIFAATVAILHLAVRRQMQQREAALLSELNETRAKLDRAEAFLAAEPQITIAWNPQDDEPQIEGAVDLISDEPIPRRVLDFGCWLSPDQAQELEGLVTMLRERGVLFRLPVVTLQGRHLEAEGRAVSGRAIIRLRDVVGDRLEARELRERLSVTQADLDAVRMLLNAIPCPSWTRDHLGGLAWTNTAYVRAVEARDMHDALARGIELLESPGREASAASRAQSEIYRARAAAVVAGWRSSLDVVEVPYRNSSAGIAFDVSELEATRIDLQQTIKAHGQTLDQLSTAVAIFDRRKQLVFYNAAYRRLWSLDPVFLDQSPSEAEILDHLRARRMLQEQADFRAWKDAHLKSYQSPETTEQVWYRPDGRTLRVVINPNPQGGVTYLFDDVTEQFHLEAQVTAQTRVQRETLDTLKEGVAVFGTDGRLKLSNAAFGQIWRLDPVDISNKPHVDTIAALCGILAPAAEPWKALRTAVAGLHDRRTGIERRLFCRDGEIIDCTAAPLPDGATLLTFTDTTATVNVERALTERNQALLETEKLRNDFVHHVSYELRSPLTNIIGFIQLLGDGTVGSLNPKQSEYVGYVMKSSAALLAIINDILDLATIDTGALELNLKQVDVLEAINAASEGVQDRLTESSLSIQVVALPGVGTFLADAKRLRQILFNLLSNAIGFSAPGQMVTLAALRRGDRIVIKVSDQGRGIPHEVLAQVFDRFHSNTIGTRHRGVGLGLSIVKSFVELHGGRVHVDSAPGVGTTVTCIFPVQGEKTPLTDEPEPEEVDEERR